MHKLLPALFLVLCNLPVCAQDNAVVNKTNPNQPSMFPVGDSAWQEYIKNHVDSTVPARNKAKPGSYTVVVRFILAKDNSISDLAAETKHGYGMEQEVMRAIIKAYPPKWTPEEKRSLLAKKANRVSFTFIVPKKRGGWKKRS